MEEKIFLYDKIIFTLALLASSTTQAIDLNEFKQKNTISFTGSIIDSNDLTISPDNFSDKDIPEDVRRIILGKDKIIKKSLQNKEVNYVNADLFIKTNNKITNNTPELKLTKINDSKIIILINYN